VPGQPLFESDRGLIELRPLRRAMANEIVAFEGPDSVMRYGKTWDRVCGSWV
jgi:hypothetical protein